jgi:hypothetical protein
MRPLSCAVWLSVLAVLAVVGWLIVDLMRGILAALNGVAG